MPAINPTSAEYEAAVKALHAIVTAVVDSVREGDPQRQGVPGGTLYAALIGKMSLSQFNSMMDAIVSAGKLRRQGQLYFAP